ncbi:MAG: VWA domain-containing protein [Rhodoferax sp.]|nr:VWA domain-containing protein [Rhodoferax sp.]
MELAHPALLTLVLAVPPWAWLAWRTRTRATQTGPRLRHPGLQALPEAESGGSRWPIALQAIAFMMFIVAAAQPREPGPWIQPPPLGRDIALVVDTSLTMSLEDFQRDAQGVSRMAVLKQVLGDFVGQRKADRFSLSVFGSEAASLTVPTFDHAHVQAQLQRLQVGVLGDDTAMGDALGLALRPLQHGTLRPAIVLVSDGEPSNAGDMTPAEAVAVARQLGVAIHTLQVGPLLRPAPDPAGNEEPQPTLADIARLTGGGHWLVRTTADATAVMQAIDRLEPTLAQPAREREVREWYVLPLVLGLLCLATAQWLARRTASGAAA